jgi:hypothetical protein
VGVQATSSGHTALRQLLEEKLIGGDSGPHPIGDTATFFGQLRVTALERGIPYAPGVVIEHWHSLSRVGVIAFIGASVPPMAGEMDYSYARLTQRGFDLLSRGQDSPHYPDRYLGSVRARIQRPDAVALSYLDDAVGCWSAGLYRASVVMLGCACERLVLMLAEAVRAAELTGFAGKIGDAFKAAERGRPLQISALFDQVRKALEWMVDNEPTPPSRLTDALDRTLTSVFDYARGLRNEGGHPTGVAIKAEEAEAALLLFPRFYEIVDGWIAHLRQPAAREKG